MKTNTSSAGRTECLNFFEPLRIISAVAIACFLHFRDHLAPTFGVDMPFMDNWLVRVLATRSAMCVQLFFLMSGILFYFHYAKKIRDGRYCFKSFALKRITRIYPLVFVTNVVCYLLYNLLFWGTGGEDAWRGTVSIWAFAKAILFCGWNGAPNGPTWYTFILLLVSFLAFFIVKRTSRNLLLIVSIFVSVILQEHNAEGMTYYVIRGVMAFFLGILLAQLLEYMEHLPANKRVPIIVGNLIIFFLMLWILCEESLFGIYIGGDWYVFATFLLWPPLLIAGYFMPALNRLCGVKPIRYLGKISFDVYLWNFPILAAIYTLNRLDVIRFDITTPIFMIGLIAVHLLVASLSSAALEKWGRSREGNEDKNMKRSHAPVVGQEGSCRDIFQNHKDLFLLLSSSAFVTSLFFLFAPLQLYITNISELWFRIGDVLWPSMAAFLLLWLGFAALGFFLYRRRKLFSWYNCLLFGLGLALYIQGNILPMDYGILNGATVEWGAYQSKAVMNALLWLVCMALPFALARFLPGWSDAIIRWLCCGLILVQLITTGILCVATDFSKSAVTDVFLSDNGLYEVSSSKNVVIFILDTLDKRFFEEVYEEDPNLVDFMDGFTYFSNMTSAYPNTRPSLPYILTGQHYLNEQPYMDYIAEAWENCADYYQALHDSGFTIKIYTGDNVISSPAKNKWVHNAENDDMKVSSYSGLEKALLQFTAMRFFPDGIKKYVWSSVDLFDHLKTTSSDYRLFDDNTAVFMERLLETGLTQTDQSQYCVIHLDGTHMPYTLRADCTEDGNTQTSASEETKGCLTMLREYIRQLKELGIYDNTSIMITGDHGFSDISKTSPVLFVKGMGQSGAMQIDNRPVSHENMMGTVMREINGTEDARFGQSVFDVTSASGYRKYYFYTQNDSYDRNYMPDMVEYDILPESNDAENFILTGKVYTDKGITESKPYSYVVGEPIIFQNSETLSYFIAGTPGYVEEDGVWSSGHRGRACFYTGILEKDLLCHIQISPYVQNSIQHIIISAGGRILYDDVVTSNMSYINFAVPKECVVEGKLILDFEYPDACSSISLGTSDEDMRDIAIKFWSITFMFQEGTEAIDFGENGNAGDHYVSGWHGKEIDGSWTNEAGSILAILPEGAGADMKITYKTHPGARNTSVYYNGEYVGILPHHDNLAQETLALPESSQSDSEAQIITFVTDGATTSKEYFGGDTADTRVLGILVSEITFEKFT